MNLLPSPFLARFHSVHLRVALRVSSASTRDVARALLERLAVVALVEAPVDDERLEVIACRGDELVVIGHAEHRPDAHRRPRRRRVGCCCAGEHGSPPGARAPNLPWERARPASRVRYRS